MTDESNNADKVFWALGGKSSTDIAHAYRNRKDYEEGICLCGRKVIPLIELEHWDLSNKLVEEHTCKGCQERLKLLSFMK